MKHENDKKVLLVRVHSIFESISGEAGGFLQGTWCTFVRLAMCNLRCVWCDTKDAQHLSESTHLMTIQQIVEMVQGYDNEHVIITGGEPLVQYEGTIELLRSLIYYDFKVQVETNGSIALPEDVHPVNWVMDYKCPSSEQQDAMLEIPMLIRNIHQVQRGGSGVYIKWVVGNGVDTIFALDRIHAMLQENPTVVHIISPLDADGTKIEGIVDDIKRRELDILDYIVFSVQLHKIFLMA